MLSIDLLAVAGFDGFFKQTNPAWEKALGWTEEELKSQAFYEFAHPEDRAATLSQLETLKQGTAITYFEHQFECKDGHYKWLGWTAAPFAAEQLIYIFARDITERRQAEEQIHVLNRQLEGRIKQVTAVNRELEAFSYSISHDLRAPLRSMQGFAQILQTECGHALPDAGREYASRLARSAAYMDQLLGDLLEYSRLGQLELPVDLVCLEPVVREVLDTLAAEIEAKGAQVEVQQPLIPVRAHRCTIKQILSNLISNALKFVHENTPPRVRIWTEERRAVDSTPPAQGDGGLHTSSGESDNPSHATQTQDGSRLSLFREAPRVRLWVEDNGIGIEHDQHEKIFGLFQRVHTAETYPGTGIGLAIVRKGAERMGGQAGVESCVGQGSRFWLELPAGVESSEQLEPKAA